MTIANGLRLRILTGVTLLFSVGMVLACTQDVSGQSLTITTGSLPAGIVGVQYNQTLSAIGANPPFTWSIVSGSIPPGLSLDSAAGTISGVPTTAGTSNFKVRVSSTSPAQTANKDLSIRIDAGPVIT